MTVVYMSISVTFVLSLLQMAVYITKEAVYAMECKITMSTSTLRYVISSVDSDTARELFG